MREELASRKKQVDDIIHASLAGFSIELGQFMNEVFKMNLLSVGAKERSLLLISLLRNAFGPEVNEALQEEWLPASGLSLDRAIPQEKSPQKTESQPLCKQRKWLVLNGLGVCYLW
jgi:hypothetical protein